MSFSGSRDGTLRLGEEAVRRSDESLQRLSPPRRSFQPFAKLLDFVVVFPV